LDAFLGAPEKTISRLRLADISPNPAQPRRMFSEESLDSLAGSIGEHGLISPLLVRRVDVGKYELVAGERRFRALKRLGRTHADAVVISAYDADSAVLALVENLQREELHFLDEAEACRAILEQHRITQEELARTLGKSPSALANRLRLIRLPPSVKDMIVKTGITERHARALLKAEDTKTQLKLIDETVEKRLTVRQLEQRIERLGKEKPKREIKRFFRDDRLYVNAVIDTVKRINTLGARASTHVRETDEGTEITIIIGHGK
jgi:ParB family chromosome partitioning protein